jgi:hypothetical protein
VFVPVPWQAASFSVMVSAASCTLTLPGTAVIVRSFATPAAAVNST